MFRAVIDSSERCSSSRLQEEMDEGRDLGPQHLGQHRREDEVHRAAGVRRCRLGLVAAEGGEEDDRRVLCDSVRWRMSLAVS